MMYMCVSGIAIYYYLYTQPQVINIFSTIDTLKFYYNTMNNMNLTCEYKQNTIKL